MFKFGFKKKEKKNSNDFKSPKFKSPSHYWTASQNDFLHSKGSANVELSIDPFNKSLIRIFCQSIDQMVNYKSIEYCPRTTVQQIIEKIIKILRLNISIDQLVLVETVGRCLLIDKDGSTTKFIAKCGQSYIYIEQNRRRLMNTDYILTVLNYWKPMFGFSRRFELCLIEKAHQMTSCVGDTEEGYSFLPEYFSKHDSLSTLSEKNDTEYKNKFTQTEKQVNPPVVPRRRISVKTPKLAHLLTLKGDDFPEQELLLYISPSLEFGSPGSDCNVILKQLNEYPNQKICVITKSQNQDNTKLNNIVYLESLCSIPDLDITINGINVGDKAILHPGDIISIGDYYSYFFKDISMDPDKRISIKHFLNSSKNCAVNNFSDISDHAITSSSISSCSDINNSTLFNAKIIKSRKKVSIDLHGINLSCFDTALNQIIIHYFDGRMDLMNTVVFALYLIRFCRESTRCSFSLDEMQNRIKKRFSKSLEVAYANDYYLLGNLKLTALTFQIWLVYNNENYIEATEENRNWLDFLELFTAESFDHLSSYICEASRNLCACFFEENPFLTFQEQQKFKENGDINTMEKFLNFLTDTFQNISKIGCDKMTDIFKNVFTSRIVTYVTESTVIQLLSDMKNFSWNKAIQISTQMERFENWLNEEGVINVFENDGFLRDFSRLISTRAVILQNMDWKTIRKNYGKIPPSILSQFLSGLTFNNSQIISAWQPSSREMTEANKDVVDVLNQYLKISETFTLFQPGIVLQTDCVAVDKFIQSMDFIAHCTVFDTELIAMGETFQWMSLPKPQSLVNFKNGKWVALRKSIGEENNELSNSISAQTNIPSASEKVKFHRKFKTDSDYSSSNKGDTITPSKKLIERYFMLKSSLKNQSKSLVSLNETENIPKPPRRKKNKGSITNLSHINSISNNYYLSQNNNASQNCFGNRSCYSRIGRSESSVSDFSPQNAMDEETGSSSSINDVDQYIKKMEIQTQSSDLFHNVDGFLNNASLTPSTENGFQGDDDEMSVGLSASGLVTRSRPLSKNSDSHIDIDDRKQLQVTLSKSVGESYGITLADGKQTNLKCEGVFIYKVTKFSPASKNGRIKPGDRIIAINDYDVDQLDFQECLMLITKSSTSVRLLIEKSDLRTTLDLLSVYQ